MRRRTYQQHMARAVMVAKSYIVPIVWQSLSKEQRYKAVYPIYDAICSAASRETQWDQNIEVDQALI